MEYDVLFIIIVGISIYSLLAYTLECIPNHLKNLILKSIEIIRHTDKLFIKDSQM